jgi:hypothetical protein
MATEFDMVREATTPKPGMALALFKRPILIDAAALDPQAVATTHVIPRGTPMAPSSGGKYKPIRRTLSDGTCSTGAKVVPVVETTMFAAGDVVEVVDLNNPNGAGSTLGTIDTISAGVSITLVANAATAVASGDIIEVAENAHMVGAVILETDVDLRDPEGTAVDKQASGVSCGQMQEASLNYNDAAGISLTRLRFELPMVDIIPTTYGAEVTPLLDAYTVDSDDIVNGAIDLVHMSANSIDSDQYVDGSIDNAHLADDAVDSDEIAAGAIDLAHMSANSVDSDQYVDGSIDAVHLAAGVGNSLVSSPTLTLVNIANADVVWSFIPGFAGTIESAQFCVGVVPASTGGKDIDLTPHIGATPTTGGVITLLTADIDAKGDVKAGTEITAANTFAATDVITVKCTEATAAFAEGSGCVILELAPA